MNAATSRAGPAGLWAAAGAGLAVLAGAILAPVGLAAQEADYPTEPPPPEAAEDVEFPAVVRDTLENGLRLVVVENHEQPVVSVGLYLPAGGTAEPEGATGLASLTASTLDRGTENRTATEIARTVEGAGASIQAGASDDWASVSTSVLTSRLDTVLAVMADVVQRPVFPDEEVANQKKRMRSSLESQLGQPGVLASRRLRAEVYGDHPYGESATPESVADLTPEDLRAFHRAHYDPAQSMLVVAGDLTGAEARRVARRHFGDWEGDARSRGELPSPPPPDSFGIHLVHRPGSSQSEIRVGHLGPEAGEADLPTLDVLNRVLGAGPASRLFLVLREEKGWTYGAGSTFTRPAHRGHFAASASVRPPVTDSALAEIMDQLRRIRNEPVSDDELDDATSYLTGHFPLEIETPQQVASRVADVLLRGRSIEYLENYRGRIATVSADDVLRAAREHLRPDSADAVVVGDGRVVLEDLRRLGPVSLYDVQGQPLDASELRVRRSDVTLRSARIRTGTFRYALRAQGQSVGEMRFRVEPGDEAGLRIHQQLSAGAMSQQAFFRVTEELAPDTVSVEQSMGPVTVARHLSYGDERVTGTARVPRQGQAGGQPSVEEMEVDTALAPGTLDGAMDLAAILSAPLASGFQMDLPVFQPGQGVVQLAVEVTGSETVTVPAGEFETWVVEISGPAAATLYVSREAPRILIRQEIAGQPVSLELQEIGSGSPNP